MAAADATDEAACPCVTAKKRSSSLPFAAREAGVLSADAQLALVS